MEYIFEFTYDKFYSLKTENKQMGREVTIGCDINLKTVFPNVFKDDNSATYKIYAVEFNNTQKIIKCRKDYVR